jgi:class 3 adenylate cyclase
VVRRLLGREGGRLVKSTGDGILAVFDGPGRGIRVALGLLAELRASGIEIRAGLHTGEVELRGDDVGGIAVHIGARIMAAAGPGEVLVSRTVRDLVAGSGIELEDRGSHTLKGVGDQWQLFAASQRSSRTT